MRLMPTSMMETPSRTMSVVTKLGRPMAAIRMSACRVMAGRSRVREWQRVTVALPQCGFAHHEKGGWFADDLAAAKDDDMAPFGFDAAMPDEFDDAGGGAGDEAALIFLAESAYVDGVEAVDVFMGSDTVEGLGFVDVRWEGCLNEDAVDIGVVVECIDLIEEGFFGDVFGQEVQAAVDADALGGLLLFADVGDGCGVVSDADKSDCWLFPRKTPDLAGEFFNDGFCDGVSVDYLHGYSKSWSVPFVNSDASCGGLRLRSCGCGFCYSSGFKVAE